LLVAGETLVLGTLRCLKERGLRTPDDVALITFGNSELAGLLDPPLTTVALPARAMGYQAMTMLQSILAGRRPRPRQVVLGTDLVIRRSCGCGDPPAA
jgi:DNA-binding LacI/PurR family transcriptional regulator